MRPVGHQVNMQKAHMVRSDSISKRFSSSLVSSGSTFHAWGKPKKVEKQRQHVEKNETFERSIERPDSPSLLSARLNQATKSHAACQERDSGMRDIEPRVLCVDPDPALAKKLGQHCFPLMKLLICGDSVNHREIISLRLVNDLSGDRDGLGFLDAFPEKQAMLTAHGLPCAPTSFQQVAPTHHTSRVRLASTMHFIVKSGAISPASRSRTALSPSILTVLPGVLTFFSGVTALSGRPPT